MQPRVEEIHRVLSTFVQAVRTNGEAGGRRRSFSLVVQGSAPLVAEFRDLRGRCAMIDIGSSIFTLAYNDILGLDPVPASDGALRVTVRPGCFASHAAARLHRNASGWRGVTPESTPRVVERQRGPTDAARTAGVSEHGRSEEWELARGGNQRRAAATFGQEAADPLVAELDELLGDGEMESGIAQGDPAVSVGHGQHVAKVDAVRKRR